MGLSRDFDASEPMRAQPLGRIGGMQEERLAERSTVLAVGTMACPSCDAPVLPAGPVAPADPLSCAFCAHAGRARDFLTLAAPSRPARVEVRVVGSTRRLVRR